MSVQGERWRPGLRIIRTRRQLDFLATNKRLNFGMSGTARIVLQACALTPRRLKWAPSEHEGDRRSISLVP